MFRTKPSETQKTLWVPTEDIVTTPANSFYQRLDRALESISFGDDARAICAEFYSGDASKGGRPGIDPEVYFKMQLVGFFENIMSERGLAARCADSLSIREFLHYDLTESTPDHSSLTVIRKRLGREAYNRVFGLVLLALKQHRLIKGKHLGIDASTMEANASLRALEDRITHEEYSEYVKRLAREAGIDENDSAAVRRFDKKRKGRRTSNKDWTNPHDPDAKIGRTKRGSMRMIYKPEHIVDLETGAIVDADVRPGDEHDTDDLAERVFDAEERMNTAMHVDYDQSTIKSLTSDKGYYKVDELATMQQHGIKTIVSDPIDNRRPENLTLAKRKAVHAAKRSATSKYGKELLRRRGQHIERSFAHVLDDGGARRTTLRGRENIAKRYLMQCMGFNLSLLMRTLTGIGTPKQALAAACDVLRSAILSVLAAILRLLADFTRYFRIAKA